MNGTLYPDAEPVPAPDGVERRTADRRTANEDRYVMGTRAACREFARWLGDDFGHLTVPELLAELERRVAALVPPLPQG